VSHKVGSAKDGDLTAGNGKFFFRFTERTLQEGFPGFLASAGETDFSALREVSGTDFKEKVKAVCFFYQRTEDCKFAPGAHQSRFMAVETTAQGVQFRAHNSIVSDC
jgi:hypothetical protein